uniref:G-protein coupled receptors family 1 profile domain-containing protein n=1 Tax=Balaenoptera musculus TaxID=9771 RepID=A0A8C0E871_BALMU
MDERNQSAGITFVLLGFSEYPYLQVLFCGGNLGMIVIIRINTKLHTPMYFFLSHLSFVDFCYSSVLTHILLEILVVDIRTISYVGCMMQFFFACTLVIIEMFMLAVMACDRFVAVCNPLLCTVAVSPKLCILLVAGTYIWGGICSLTITYSLLELSFCGSKLIHGFACEYSAIISASCSDPYFRQMTCFIISTLNEACSVLIILTSYVFIIVTIIKMSSADGLQKAFSACASRLTAVTIFHGTILFLYSVPTSKSSRLFIKVATVSYILVIPMLKPLIYSLRNNDKKRNKILFMSHSQNVIG